MNTQQFNSKLHEIHHLQDSEINTVLDCYIRVIGSFPNSTLQHHFGVEVLNGKQHMFSKIIAGSCSKV